MKELKIDLIYEDIEEIIEKQDKSFVIKFKNGDRLTFKKSERTKQIRRHLKKNFSGEHLE